VIIAMVLATAPKGTKIPLPGLSFTSHPRD
jgi:hypothetical protein